jgi:hypothetical protein
MIKSAELIGLVVLVVLVIVIIVVIVLDRSKLRYINLLNLLNLLEPRPAQISSRPAPGSRIILKNYPGARERDPRTLASELPRSSREPR